jgi:hypothetical protein
LYSFPGTSYYFGSLLSSQAPKSPSSPVKTKSEMEIPVAEKVKEIRKVYNHSEQ